MQHTDPKKHDLVEPQGVNAGPAVDKQPDTDLAEPPSGAEPPDALEVPGVLYDEMAGLPEQRPGHPGQQRSIDTS